MYTENRHRPNLARYAFSSLLATLIVLASSTSSAFSQYWSYQGYGGIGCAEFYQCGSATQCTVVYRDKLTVTFPPPFPDCMRGTSTLTYHNFLIVGDFVSIPCEDREYKCILKDSIWVTFHRSHSDGFRIASDALTFVELSLPNFIRGPPRWYLSAASYLAGAASVLHQQLADDPPDPNYQVIFEYPVRDLSRDWGLSAASNDYLNRTLLALARANDALAGELASNERALGAHEALDFDAADAQLAAGETFREDYQLFANEAKRLVDGLPSTLQSEGVNDISFDSAAFEAAIDELERNGVPADLQSLLVELTGDSAAPDQYLAYARTLRGSTTMESAFSSLLLLAQELAVSDCSNGRDDDGDGLVDFPEDDGCISPDARSEIRRDLNFDRVVDEDDRLAFVATFGLSEGTYGYVPEADFDGDGQITLVDFQQWLVGYEEHLATQNPRATCGLLGLELLLLVPIVRLTVRRQGRWWR